MAKHYAVSNKMTQHVSYEAAEEHARRSLSETDAYGRIRPSTETFIYESLASVKAPVPEAVVTKF